MNPPPEPQEPDHEINDCGSTVVRLAHNPALNADVDKIKRLGAELIDEIMGLPEVAVEADHFLPHYHYQHLRFRAIERIEEGVMLAVKFATTEGAK